MDLPGAFIEAKLESGEETAQFPARMDHASGGYQDVMES
jgi:hypothetical protein